MGVEGQEAPGASRKGSWPGLLMFITLGSLACTALGSSLGAAAIYCFCSNDCSMSDYKCLWLGARTQNSHDLLPKLMEPQMGFMSLFHHQSHFQGRSVQDADARLTVGM